MWFDPHPFLLSNVLDKTQKGDKTSLMDNLIKALRKKRRMTQNELAYCCNVSRQTIIAVEKGTFSPSLSLAYKLAKVLDYQMEDMYDFSALDAEIRSLEQYDEETKARKIQEILNSHR